MHAAFFDLDNTLIRGSSLFIVVKHLVAEGHLSRRVLAQAASTHALYRLTARETGADRAGTRGLELARGWSAEWFEDWARTALHKALPTASYGGSLALLKSHQDAGHRTYIATAAPIEIALTVAEMLGCDGAVGTVADRRDGAYTGMLVTPFLRGQAKADAVAALAAANGIDLAHASAYSDSHNDLPMLRLVSDPHAVNPDGRLRRVARTEDWPVHDVSIRRAVFKATAVAVAATAAAVGVAQYAKRPQ